MRKYSTTWYCVSQISTYNLSPRDFGITSIRQLQAERVRQLHGTGPLEQPPLPSHCHHAVEPHLRTGHGAISVARSNSAG